jgi:predicted Zn-dependent peptidase
MQVATLWILATLSCATALAQDAPPPEPPPAQAREELDPVLRALLGRPDLAAVEVLLQRLVDDDRSSAFYRNQARLALRVCAAVQEYDVTDPVLVARWLAAAFSADLETQRAVVSALAQNRIADPEALPAAVRGFEPPHLVRIGPEEVAAAEVALPAVRDLGGLPSALAEGLVDRVLPNGLHLTVAADPRLAVSVVIHRVAVGSAQEVAGETGAAHLVEHLMFAGTAAFPEDAWWRDLSGIGGDANAFTGWDDTTYVTRVVPEGLETVLRMEADRFGAFDPTEEALRREQAVIADELRLSTGLGVAGRRDEGRRRALLGDHPYGRPIGGDAAAVAAMSRDRALAFHRRTYGAANVHLVIVGPHDAAAVAARVEELYAGMPRGEVPTAVPTLALVPARSAVEPRVGPRRRLAGMAWPLGPNRPCLEGREPTACSDDYWATQVALVVLARDGVPELQRALSASALMRTRVEMDAWRGASGGYLVLAAERHAPLGVATWNILWTIASGTAFLGETALTLTGMNADRTFNILVPPYRHNPTPRRVREALDVHDGEWLNAGTIEAALDAARFGSLEQAWGAEARAAALVERGWLGLPLESDPAEDLEALSPEDLQAALQRILDQEGVRLHVR